MRVWLLLWGLVAASSPSPAPPSTASPVTKVAVVDVSQPDAIFEDVSRGIADEVVEALKATGLQAVRIDERDLPEAGCRLGPCLGEAAKAQQAQVVVMVDCAEKSPTVSTVRLAALWATNGAPVAVSRYDVEAEHKKVPKPLRTFAVDVAKAKR